MAITSPAPDEIEFSLLGPGYGECAVIHYGGGEWLIVDSCIDQSGTPAALKYLNQIGVDVGTAVRMIVVTHWHDDHIRGVSELVEYCPRAEFVCPAALRSKEFFTLIAAYANGATTIQSGIKEMANTLKLVVQRGTTVRLASENTLLLRRSGCQLWALSPSAASTLHAMAHLATRIPQPMQSKGAVPPPTPNHLSVALLAQLPDTAILVGGDVLQFSDRNRGWLRIADLHAQSNHPASDIVKIPHHGSSGADSDDMWDRLLRVRPIATLTPFCRGNVSLPTPNDAARICGRASEAYSTAHAHQARPSRRPRAVEKTIADVLRNRRLWSPKFGRVTLRSEASQPRTWSVQLSGSAYRLCH